MIVRLGKNGNVCQMGTGEVFRPERVFQGDMTLGAPASVAEALRADQREKEKKAMEIADAKRAAQQAKVKAAQDAKRAAMEMKRVEQEAEASRKGFDPMMHLALSQTLAGKHMSYRYGLSGNPLTADGRERPALTMGFSFADALTSAQNVISTVGQVKSLITGPSEADIAAAQAAAYAQQKAAAEAQAQATIAQAEVVREQTLLEKAKAAASNPMYVAGAVAGVAVVGLVLYKALKK